MNRFRSNRNQGWKALFQIAAAHTIDEHFGEV